jgi:hypothetical protein
MELEAIKLQLPPLTRDQREYLKQFLIRPPTAAELDTPRFFPSKISSP